MAYSTQRTTSDGTLDTLDLSIEYLDRANISVFFDGLPAELGVDWDWVGETDATIQFTPTVPNGVEVLVQRSTALNKLLNVFSNGAKFNNFTMDENFTQLLLLTQEAVEGAGLTDIFNDVDYHGFRIINLGTAVDPGDAVSLGQATEATSDYADAAAASADLAEDWATKTSAPVSGGLYGARYYAEAAADALADTVQVDVANTFIEDQTISKNTPKLAFTDTRTALTDGTTVAEIPVTQSDTDAPGLSAAIRAIADGTGGKLLWDFLVGLPGSLTRVLRIKDTGVEVTGTIEVGHASDTTLARSSAGQISVEGSLVYQQNNIVGAVSQSSGVPTGAIINQGSNAGGSWIRYADGTQICWRTNLSPGSVEAASGAIYASSPLITWTFPVSFVSGSVPSVLPGQCGSSVASRWMAFDTPTNVSVALRVLSTTNNATALTASATAIGRWF